MSRKWATGIALVGALAVLLLFALPAPLSEFRTLASLRRVDDHPLYVMRFYGDYGFRGVIGEGTPATSHVGGSHAWACTCFAAVNRVGDVLFGRNFDWYDHAALLLFTDPSDGYASVSMVDISYLGFGYESPSWSERGSLLRAPHMPFDGMNEHGLSVGMMAVPHAEAMQDFGLPTLDSLQLIRLLLDNARDVDQAVDLLSGYNVDFGTGPPVHYMLADAEGRSAVVEYVDDKLHILRNEHVWQVCTNFILSEAPPDGPNSSCWRYNKIYETLRGTGGALSEEEAMSLLQSVSGRGEIGTIWSVVYSLNTQGLQVVMGRNWDQAHDFELLH